jgi:hypothetical protein
VGLCILINSFTNNRSLSYIIFTLIISGVDKTLGKAMKKKSAIHLCLIGGSVLLIAQLSLLGLLLYPHNQHHAYFLKDVETVVNITSKLHMSVFAVDSEALQHFTNQKNGPRMQCVLCGTKHPATFVTLFRGIKQSVSIL